jgi:hypothetical protein
MAQHQEERRPVMNDFLEAVRRTPLSLFLQTHADLLIPSIQGAHIIALAIVFTSAAFIDLRILGVAGGHQPLPAMTRRFLPMIGWCLAILAASGLLLMIAEPTRALLNHFFQLKMAALVVVCAMTWSLGASAARDPEAWAEPEKKPRARLFAIGSLALWALIIISGRWIAYGG